jgi:sterol desaturase/sphingolipid hydroxylase (fatty acid hydroxylase superfamily)
MREEAKMTGANYADLLGVLRELLISTLIGLVVFGAMLALMSAVEMTRPARPPSSKHAWFNVRYSVAMQLLLVVLQPILVGAPLILPRAFGAGWITFADGILGWCLGFVAVLLLTDLLEYLFHRAQHHFPVLWKMHELHHSAEHFDVTVTYRNFWAEPLLKAAFLYPLVAVVLKVPAGVGAAVAAVYFVSNHVAHMNLRFSPRFALLVQNPQFHRLHHSRHARDYNKNFSTLLPLWDVVFGTVRRPARDEFVEVGLESVEPPRSVWQALLWPWYSKRQSSASLMQNAVQNSRSEIAP